MATLTEVRPHHCADLTRGATGPRLGCRCHGGKWKSWEEAFQKNESALSGSWLLPVSPLRPSSGLK